MLKPILLFLSVSVMVLTSLPQARADIRRACCRPVPKWYVGLGGGVSFMPDYSLDATTPNTVFTTSTELDPGFSIMGQLGYKIYPGIRTELELLHIYHGDGSIASIVGGTGNITNTSFCHYVKCRLGGTSGGRYIFS